MPNPTRIVVEWINTIQSIFKTCLIHEIFMFFDEVLNFHILQNTQQTDKQIHIFYKEKPLKKVSLFIRFKQIFFLYIWDFGVSKICRQITKEFKNILKHFFKHKDRYSKI